MGKRKRALSPKENTNEQTCSSTNGPKAKTNEENEVAGKSETQDKATSNNSSIDTEAPVDDRPIPQLRISARVQNKQRREESKDHLSVALARKVDGTSQDEEEEEEKKVSGAEGDRGISHNGELKKRRRAWELWSLEDKNTFFEAINECGKDFEAIQNFLVTKLRKKGIPTCVIKNKDQVRHFYYRTWHKISKHIKFDDDVKKSTQELYTLINYGELRRKIGGTLDEKKGQKLQELIQKGSTSVRIKGKTVRVKTPICRALKKLNEFPDEREQTGVRVPVSVTVEIVPANIMSWNQVQSVAHNPRVRISCSMHKSVASIIEHLQNKWRSTKLKICDSLIASASFPVDCTSPTPMSLRLCPPPFTDFNNVYLKTDTQVKSFAVSLSSHSQMLQRKGEMELQNPKGKSSKPSRKKKNSPPTSESLKDKHPEEVEHKEDLKEDPKYKDEEKGEISQEENEEGSDVEIEEELGTPPPVVISPSDEYLSNKEEEVVFISCHSPKRQPIPYVKSSSLETVCVEMREDSFNLSPSYEEEILNAVKNIKEEVTDPMETIHQLMALENVANTQEIEDDADVICIGERTKLSAQIDDTQKKIEERATSTSSEQEELKSPTPLDIMPAGGDETCLNFAHAIEKAKKGWTLKTCGLTTIGELYLMFGKNQQISLEYEFEELETADEEVSTLTIGDSGINKVDDGGVVSFEINDSKEGSSNGVNSSMVSSVLASPVRPPSSSQISLPVEASSLSSPVAKSTDPEGESGSSQTSAETKSQNEILNKNKAAENISSMLAKLIYMIKIISSKSPVECVCGNVAPSKNAFSHLRSPSNARHLNGFFKSPGNTKSPRGCSLSVRSPRTPTSANSPRDGGPALKTEKTKPTSAKRLIPECSSEKNIPSTSSVDSVPSTSKDKTMMDNKREASVGVIINSKDLPSTSTSGEFRVPIAPAPRNPACQVPNQSFNAQLSKLLPRYSRPSRRSVRKNMVVQRQLPLMPRQPRTSQGFVAVKVGNLQEFNINTTSQISLPIAVSMTSNPLVNTGSNQVCSTGEVQQTIPSILIQQQPSSASMPIIAGTFVSETNDSNAISVNVSGHQLLTVKMPSYPVSPVVTTISTVSSITQSSSTVSFATSDTVSTTTTCALPLVSDVSSSTLKQIYQDSDSNSSFSNLIAQSFGDSAYLSTPPSTPIQFENILNTPSCISKEELNCYNENSNSSYISISDIDVRPLNTPLSTPIKGSLISSASETSLLQTPTHSSDNRIGNKNSVTDISPIKLNLSTFLSSPNSILNSTHIDSCTTEHEDIPQIHIPECGDNLPMLDISIGGTISLKARSTNVVSDMPVTSIVDVITPISSIETLSSMPSMPSFINDTTPVSETQSIMSGVSHVPNMVDISNVSSIVHLSTVNNLVPASNIGSVMPLDQQAISSRNIGTGMPHSQNIIDHMSQRQIPPSSTVMGFLPHLSTVTSIPHSTVTVVNSDGSSNLTEHPRGISLSVTCVTTSVTSVESFSRRENVMEEPTVGLNSFQDSNDKMIDITLSNSNSNSSFTSFLTAAANQPCLDSVMENSLLTTPPRPLLSGGVTCGTKSNLSFDGEGFEPLTEVPLSPPSSPSRLLRHTEVQWINNENEFSLSSLLGSMDSSSPLKGAQPPQVGPSISQSPQMRALFSTLNDNSVDFTSTFASLKKQTKDKDRSE